MVPAEQVVAEVVARVAPDGVAVVGLVLGVVVLDEKSWPGDPVVVAPVLNWMAPAASTEMLPPPGTDSVL